jgi:hypothetical protein
LQSRGFSTHLRDSGFVLHLDSQMHFGQKPPASQMREPLIPHHKKGGKSILIAFFDINPK